MMQALLQPKVKEMESWSKRLDSNIEQNKVWLQQVNGILAKMSESRSQRKGQH